MLCVCLCLYLSYKDIFSCNEATTAECVCVNELTIATGLDRGFGWGAGVQTEILRLKAGSV